MHDGHFNQCRSCQAKRIKKYRLEHPDLYKEQQERAEKKHFFKAKKYRLKHREDTNERCRIWRKNNPERANEFSNRWKRNNVKKRKAQAIAYAAVRNGTRKPLTCEVCFCIYGISSKAEAHHCNYKKPMELLWLCPKHHRAWHRVFIAEAA
jgi:hypothetical protein